MVKIPEGNFVEYEGDIVHPHDIKGADGLIIDDTLITEGERRENSRVEQEELYEIMLAEQEAYEAEQATRNKIPLEVTETGPSVRLVDRALAIEAIMAYYNQANKNAGAQVSRSVNKFDSHYKDRHIDPDRVMDGMTKKQSFLYRKFTEAISVLSASDDMRKAGYSSDEVTASEQQLKRAFYRKYGPGKAKVADRDKLIRKVNKTVRIVVEGKRR